MASVKLTKNELKVQKDALKMYRRYLPTLTLKKQQLQTEIFSIRARAAAVRQARAELERGFDDWIAVFSEAAAFPEGLITVRNIRRGQGNIAGVGDKVRVMETRPLSKDKRWRLVKIIEKAK